MSQSTDLQLAGSGAAYIRVSTDQQDTVRQHQGVHSFEHRNGITITKDRWYEDQGWARDTADERPDFQRMIKDAEAGRVQWIVVDQIDRFGTKGPHHLIYYIHRLRECGCRLFDVSGSEWTGDDFPTLINTAFKGNESKEEPRKLSHRVLGGKAAKARAGVWQGGPVRLGFDTACFAATGPDTELWRVVFEGDDKRLKVYPDGRTERFDGEKNFPPHQKKLEYLRIVPSRDQAKIDAAVSVFERYASESISFTTLARHLNERGFRSSFGGLFHGHHIEHMLADPIYLGYYTWNRSHHGKFHRWAGGETVPELNYEEKVSKNDKADWVQSHRLFKELVCAETWNAAQRKLEGRDKRTNAPRSAALYLSGLVHCTNCGVKMVAGPTRKPKSGKRRDGFAEERYHLMCGTYHRFAKQSRVADSPCLRNAVTQHDLEGFIQRYLDETGKKLEQLIGAPDGKHITDKMRTQYETTWTAFQTGIDRLTGYLAEHHPEEYNRIIHEDNTRRAGDEVAIRSDASSQITKGWLASQPGIREAWQKARKGNGSTVGGDDFVAAAVACYRANFDPAAIGAEIERLDAEHETLRLQCLKLTAPRAIEKTNRDMVKLEARIKELEQQRDDTAGLVEQHYREVLDLQSAIAAAKLAMRSESGERTLRQRAEAIRTVIQRVECAFTATGVTGGGPGKSNARLATVTIYPVTGDPAEFSAGHDNVLRSTSVVSR